MVDTAGAVAIPADLLSAAAPLQDKPASSFDGRQHLLSWQEWNGSYFDIRVSRLRDSDGALLNPQPPVLFATSQDNQLYPRSASNGSVHLVVWGDRLHLRAARVRGDDRAMLNLQRLTLPVRRRLVLDSPSWAGASDGTDFLVTWIEHRLSSSPAKLLGARIRASDGAVLDPVARPLVEFPIDPLYMGLAFAGSHYLAVWTDPDRPSGPSSVYARRLGTDGIRIGVRITLAEPLPGGLYSPTLSNVVGAGDVALAFWERSAQVRGRRVRVADGNVLDSSELAITPSTVTTTSGEHGRTVAGFDGEHFLFLWPTYEDGRQVGRLSRVTLAGELLDPNGVLATVPGSWPARNAAISTGPGGRVLASYARHSTGRSLGADRLHWRWFGRAARPPTPRPRPMRHPTQSLTTPRSKRASPRTRPCPLPSTRPWPRQPTPRRATIRRTGMRSRSTRASSRRTPRTSRSPSMAARRSVIASSGGGRRRGRFRRERG